MTTADSDSFDLAALRDSTLAAWRDSPTRLAEDLATEADLADIGYRDRLFTELVANAADAAAAAGEPGRVAVWADGASLIIANTGSPLTLEGARSLLAVRVSAKHHDHGAGQDGVVGRFGVGFSAVAGVADRVEIRSANGGVVFDRHRAAQAAHVPAAPLLRLAWPADHGPPSGFDTAVVLTPTGELEIAALLSDFAARAPDLLLELPALESIQVADEIVAARRETVDAASGITRITLTFGAGTREWLQASGRAARWLVELHDGVPVPCRSDVLRAPTETDIELSLPVRCIAAVPVTPDRRQLYPGADVTVAADGYVGLVRALAPEFRNSLVPVADLPRNPIDAALRAAVVAALRDETWIAVAGSDDDSAGRSAVLFADLSNDLSDALADVFADLVVPQQSSSGDAALLRSVGASELSLAELAAQLQSMARPPLWWHRLYEALSPYVGSAHDTDELGALPVPRSDGRMNIGARGLLLPRPGTPAVSWLPTVAAPAVHPLLERLGAQPVTTDEILADDRLRDALEEAADTYDDADDFDADTSVRDEVLALVEADASAHVPAWVSCLLIPATDGELRRADELLLPDSPLATVLVDDSPFGLVSAEMVDRWGSAVLRRVGVGWTFALLHDQLPTGPDHDLADEQTWWDTLTVPPEELWAVRDLDLVGDDKWPQALGLLADDPHIVAALSDAAGYTAWWLRHFAVFDGRPLGCLRVPSQESLAGVLDVLDHPQADVFAAAAAQTPLREAATAEEIVENLVDAERLIEPGAALTAYQLLAQALLADTVAIERLVESAPEGVARTLGGRIADAPLVIDQPWLLQVVPSERAVVAGLPVDVGAAEVIAELFGLELASEALDVEIPDPGRPTTWASSAEAIAFAAQRAGSLGRGAVRLHDDLIVTVRGDGDGDVREVSVSWWVDGGGTTHLAR